ncbi:MAG: amidohydrolase [Pseudomonadota bacterium]
MGRHRRIWMNGATVGMLLLCSTAIPASQPPADLIVRNADIYTVDPAQPRASAFAVRAGRIVALGDEVQVRPLQGPATRALDVAGATVLPGLIDGHVHLRSGASLLRGVDLYGIAERNTWLKRIAARDKQLPKGLWLIGGLWDHTIADDPLPTRQELDAVLPDRPVVLTDVDGHSVWVNSVALKLAGITADTEDPADGAIVRDTAGEPTGILLEGAMNLVRESQAYRDGMALTAAKRLALIEDIFAYANSLGLTGAHEMNDRGAFDEYETLLAAGRLNLRLWYGVTGEQITAESAHELRQRADRIAAHRGNREHGPRLQMGYLKLVVDGVLSTRTAVLLQPYSDRVTQRGLSLIPRSELFPAVAAANAADFPVAVHAIGDGAVRLALDAFAASERRPSFPNRIEHIELVHPDDVPRFKSLGVVASMNPHHGATTFYNYLRARVGAAREPRAYAWQTFLAAEIPLVLGSDWYTAPLNPFVQLWAAVFREDAFGKVPGAWRKEQALTLAQALHAYTQAPANASGWGEELGSLSVGKWADFIVLDRSLADPVTPALRDAQVQSTWIAGQPVFETDVDPLAVRGAGE